LVSDLQNANAPVQLPTLKSRPRLPAGAGWGLRIATAAVLVLLGMGIGWGLYGNTASPLSFETDPGAKSDGISRQGADAASAAAIARRAQRLVRTDEEEVR
jgi:hypothetical protein